MSALSLPRSIRIIAAVLPTALVIEKMRKTVSTVAGCPGLRSPVAPDQTTPPAGALGLRGWCAIPPTVDPGEAEQTCPLHEVWVDGGRDGCMSTESAFGLGITCLNLRPEPSRVLVRTERNDHVAVRHDPPRILGTPTDCPM